MAVKSAQAAADKWSQRMAQASAAYQAGIGAVTESPMSKAAQNLDKAAANYQQAVSSGRMAAALNNVSISTWKQQCQLGASRLASGAQKGAPKMLRAMTALQPVWQQMRAAADSAPDDPIAKVTAALQVIMAAKGAGKSY